MNQILSINSFLILIQSIMLTNTLFGTPDRQRPAIFYSLYTEYNMKFEIMSRPGLGPRLLPIKPSRWWLLGPGNYRPVGRPPRVPRDYVPALYNHFGVSLTRITPKFR